MAGNHHSGGRNRRPVAFHLLHGTYRHDRHGGWVQHAGLDLPRLSTDCPEELVGDDVALSAWARTIQPLIRIGQVTAADREVAIAWCILWSTWRSHLESAARHDHVVSVAGRPLQNPARNMANKTYTLLAKTTAELGLSPLMRGRIPVVKRREASAIEAFKAEKLRTVVRVPKP